MQLGDKLEEKFRLDSLQKKALSRLKIFSVADLLFHFPVRYSDISELKRISELVPGDMATVYGKVSNLKTKKAFRSKIPMAERRHPRPDICAMIYLHEKFGGYVDDEDGTSRDAVCSAEHDQIWLDWEPGKFDITEDDALYLTRCGVRYDSSTSSFAMFV